MKLLTLLIILFSIVATAQEKHPRVAELEDKYKKDSMDYLEARFPGLPISVSVSIIPTRRSFSGSYELKGEQLPFYALDEEQIRDEWDDPTTTLYSLSNRVNKVKLVVQVPSSLKDDEFAEIQASLTTVLRLIPARDEIQIMKREWTLFPNIKLYALFAFGILIILMLGLTLISRLFANRMASALGKLKNQPDKNSQGPAPTHNSLETKTKKTNATDGSDLRFNDPIKVREVAARRVEELLQNGDFIRLENFLKLDKLGQTDPSTLGAFLVMFPIDIQKELFSLSTGDYWMEAFDNPGEVNFKCLELFEELCRVKPNEYRPFWELLLLQTWRMGAVAKGFLKSLTNDQAFALLVSMPKNIAVPMAREAFPGNWAAVLDPEFKSKDITEKDCEGLYLKTLDIKPLVSFDILDVYKKESELLEYLTMADINTEKEIYAVTPDDSIIKQIRPPFYVIFDEDADYVSELTDRFSIEHWSLALFNAPRDLRKKIELHFTEKEKFFFLEKLKAMDKVNPKAELIGQIRQDIARYYKELCNKKHNDLLHGKINNEKQINNIDDVA